MELAQELVATYGYISIFGLFALSGLGIPVPDEALLTFVGYLTSISMMNFITAVIICFAGAFSAMIINYIIGKKLGKPLLLKYGKWMKLTPKKLQKVESWFNKYGAWTIIIGNFIPGVRRLTCYLSGVSEMKLTKYILLSSLSSFCWCLVFNLIGFYLGALPW